jgi:signal transduction histidine kinase
MALDLTDPAHAASRSVELLAGIADALAIPDLDEALGRFATLVEDATGAARCEVLLAEGARLRVIPRGERKGRSRALDVLLDPAAGLADLLDRPDPTVIADPATWSGLDALTPAVVAPDATAVALAPLRIDGHPVGAVVASWGPGEARVSSAAAAVLVGVADIAATAVRQADALAAAHRWAHAHDVLAACAAALAAPLTPGLITRQLVDGYADLLGPRLCLVGVLDETRDNLVAIASRGGRRIRGSVPLDEIPQHLVRRLCREWSTSNHPVNVGDERWLADAAGGRQAGVGWYHLVPLTIGGRIAGAVLLGFEDKRQLDVDEQDWAITLAELGDGALERHGARERHVQRGHELEAVSRMAAVFVDAPDRTALLARLRELLAGYGIELVSVSFRDQRLARRLGTDEPAPEEETAWRVRAPVPIGDGTLAVPLRLGARPVGTIRVRPADLTSVQQSLVDTLAAAFADLSARRAARLALEEAERERALKDERDRLAADLHDTAGQLFVAISVLAHRDEDEADETVSGRRSARMAELAERGKWELDQAVRALAFVPSTRHGVVPAVRALARSLSEDSGIEVLVEVTGRPIRLPPKAERALYRVACDALTDAWRHARCAVARVEVAFAADEVTLRVLDDGVGLSLRQHPEGAHGALTAMRRALAQVDGTLRVRNAKPRGVAIEARVARSAGGG